MSSIFYYCNNLAILNISNFNTNNATNMDHMFYNCKSLTSLDVSSFDTSNVTSMSYMFSSCINLTTTINIKGTKCETYSSLFSDASITSSKITVNYTSDASSLVNNMIKTKSSTSNVVKGLVIS